MPFDEFPITEINLTFSDFSLLTSHFSLQDSLHLIPARSSTSPSPSLSPAVGSGGSCSSSKQWFDGLKDLKALNNLKGDLKIKFQWPENVTNVVNVDNETEGLYLKNKKHLEGLNFGFRNCEDDDGDMDTEESRRLMEELQPHSNLKALKVNMYRGVRMPSWITLLPNLVRLSLKNCKELGHLPCLGNLRHLEYLRLQDLTKLEYVEINPSVFNSTPGSGSAEGVSFFASLKRLELNCLPKLKGWAGVGAGADLLLLDDCDDILLQLRLCLSQLKSLEIEECPRLTCMLPCPGLESLSLSKFNRRLRMMKTCIKTDEKLGEVPSPSRLLFYPENSRSNSITILIPTLRKVYIDNVVWLNSLPMEAFQGLERLAIDESIEGALESLEEVNKVFCNCSSSLQDLDIRGFDKLRSMSGALEHLTALKKLRIENCPNVRLSEVAPWRSLHHSLLFLDCCFFLQHNIQIVRGLMELFQQDKIRQCFQEENPLMEANKSLKTELDKWTAACSVSRVVELPILQIG
ncbi:hypothetical protein SOVF_113510 [Spinacia oleracea]|nr:hypothetical protein SOVF_113510 [Spinacia oleracea]